MFTLELVQLWHQSSRPATSTVAAARRGGPRQLRAALARHARRHH